MSTITQKEIASNENHLLDTIKSNKIMLNLSLMACTIILTVGTIIFLLPINATVAYFMPVLIALATYPLYSTIKCRGFFELKAFLALLTLPTIISSLLIFLPNSEFKAKVLFAICLLVLSAICAGLILVTYLKGYKTRTFSMIITTIFFTTIAIMTLIFFKDFDSNGITLTLWKGVALALPLSTMAFTLFGTIIAFCSLNLLISLIFMHKKMQISTKYITYIATFTALSVIFKLISNSISGALTFIRLTLVYIPWVGAGIVVGPIGAMISAFIGDFLGQIMLPLGGSWFWLTGLSNTLWPLATALIFKYVKTAKSLDWLKLLMGVTISAIFCTLTLGTIAYTILNGATFWVNLTPRLIQLVVIAINYTIMLGLLPVFKRARQSSPLIKAIN